MALSHYFATLLPAVDTEMRRVVAAPDEPTLTTFYGMLHYHLGWADADFKPADFDSGKHIRPVLTLLCCEASGGDWHSALPAAAAVELLHNFSLIHDDIEDGDPVRRGRPTLWKVWGKAQAINAGDALYALAHLALHGLRDTGLPADRVLECRRCFDRACLILTQGQHLDLGFEQRAAVTEAEYLHMIDGKTAALVAAACAMGAIVAGSDMAACYDNFGRELGLAFQIEDDVLGIWGDPEATGKPAGNDILHRKKSLPVAYGLDRSAELRQLYAQPEIHVAAALAELNRIGAREYTEQLAVAHHQLALAALRETGNDNAAVQALRELAVSLLNRKA